MLQTILDIILFIPRVIYNHFYDFKCFKQDNKHQETIIHNQQLLLKRILRESEYYMQMNSAISYVGFQKIKSLASTFPNNVKLD